MNPGTQPTQRFDNATAKTTTASFAAAAASTTATTTTTTLPTASSKLLKTDLRYVPVAMSSGAAKNVTGVAAMHCTTPMPATAMAVDGSGALLHVLPTTMSTNANVNGTFLPQVAYITSAAAAPGAQHQQKTSTMLANNSNRHPSQNGAPVTATPINILVTGATSGVGGAALPAGAHGGVAATTSSLIPGIAVVQTSTAGLTGSILIRNQAPYAGAIVQRSPTGVAIPLLNQEMVKQIVVGNTPRTLLKAQLMPQRPSAQAPQLFVQQQKQQQDLTTATPMFLMPQQSQQQQQQNLPTPMLFMQQQQKQQIDLSNALKQGCANVNIYKNPRIMSQAQNIENAAAIATSMPVTATTTTAPVVLTLPPAVKVPAKTYASKLSLAEAFEGKMVLPIMGAETSWLSSLQQATQYDLPTATSINNTLAPPIALTASAKHEAPDQATVRQSSPVLTQVYPTPKQALDSQLSLLDATNELLAANIEMPVTETDYQFSTLENTIEPHLNLLAQKAFAEKRESLLKAKPVQKRKSIGSTSPRTKRAKSLNYTLGQAQAQTVEQNVATERRRSEGTPLGKAFQQVIFVARKQQQQQQKAMLTTVNEKAAQSEVIDLVDEPVSVNNNEEAEVISLINCDEEYLENTGVTSEATDAMLCEENDVLLSENDGAEQAAVIAHAVEDTAANDAQAKAEDNCAVVESSLTAVTRPSEQMEHMTENVEQTSNEQNELEISIEILDESFAEDMKPAEIIEAAVDDSAPAQTEAEGCIVLSAAIETEAESKIVLSAAGQLETKIDIDLSAAETEANNALNQAPQIETNSHIVLSATGQAAAKDNVIIDAANNTATKRQAQLLQTAIQDTDVERSIATHCIKVESSDIDDTNNNTDFKRKDLTQNAAAGNDSMSLLCDEQILITSCSGTSSSSNSSMLENTSPNNILSPATSHGGGGGKLKNANTTAVVSTGEINSYSSTLDMLSTFNMLNWKERVGTARGTYLRFQLNEFNLLQVHERCPTRQRIHTAYEKPIYERETLPTQSKEQAADPLLYLCRRCNCHGPAADFLAPEFCSLECLNRNTRKRSRASVNVIRKQPRKEQQQQFIGTQSRQHSTILVKKYFRWSTYLTGGKYSCTAAPIDMFLNPFPTGPNCFQVGMKLEAIDPENCSLFCVCTVRAIQGYRLKLAFDGYEHMYDFWVNADSMDIFPPGWCGKTNRVLQPPRGTDAGKFNWSSYLSREKSSPAHRQLFTHLNAATLSTRNPFKIGMHLEAEDLNDTGKLCVATVADVLDERIRVHFDGWDNCYDYWVDISSPYIHPCGWHEGRQQLIVPPEFENYSFNWTEYIRQQGSGIAAHAELFVSREPIDFKSSMKLEVVDPRNPSLIRPATVVGRKGHRIKLHLDCWPSEYCFWMEDDSPDLHPIGWCDATGHDLEPPPGYQMRPLKLPCCISGCRGIGNTKRLYLNTHSAREFCPYAPENWRQKVEKPARVNSDDVVRQAPTAATHNPKMTPAAAGRNNNAGGKSSTLQLQPLQHYLSEQQLLENIKLLGNISTRRVLQEQLQKAAVPAEHKPNADDCAALAPIKQERLGTPPQKQETAAQQSPPSECSKASSSCSSSSGSGDTAQAFEPDLHIAKQYLCDYGPRLRQNYTLWQQHTAFDKKLIKDNPLHWSTAEACGFVERTLHCADMAACFAREDIDGAALLLIQQADLTDMLGLKLGPAIKLYSHILQLRTVAVCDYGVEMLAAQK